MSSCVQGQSIPDAVKRKRLQRRVRTLYNFAEHAEHKIVMVRSGSLALGLARMIKLQAPPLVRVTVCGHVHECE
jgi:RNase P protein component